METPQVGTEGETVGCWSIRLRDGIEPAEFEKAWKAANVLSVPVGHQTRGGIVTASYLLRSEDPDDRSGYRWMVHWREQGGSPFGAINTPGDPRDRLDGIEIETSYSAYKVR